MNNYLINVISAVAMAIIADMATSFFAGKQTEKFIRSGISICITACILMPVINGIGDGFENIRERITVTEEYTEMEGEDVYYIFERECEQKLKEYIYEKTGAVVNSAEVHIKKDGDKITVNKAVLKVNKEYSKKHNEIVSAATEAVGREADILYVE